MVYDGNEVRFFPGGHWTRFEGVHAFHLSQLLWFAREVFLLRQPQGF